jgi:hypothetical protein
MNGRETTDTKPALTTAYLLLQGEIETASVEEAGLFAQVTDSDCLCVPMACFEYAVWEQYEEYNSQ